MGEIRDNFSAENIPTETSAEVIEKVKNNHFFDYDYVLAPWIKQVADMKEGGLYNCKVLKVKESSRSDGKRLRPILVVFFIPIEMAKEIVWLKHKNHKLVLEGDNFVFYRAYQETDGVERSEIRYEKVALQKRGDSKENFHHEDGYSLDFKERLEVYTCGAKYEGMRFCLHFFSGDCGQVYSKEFIPPFSELSEEYRKMAEKKWCGQIVAPGLWIKDAFKISSNVEFSTSGSDSQEYMYWGDWRDPLALVDISISLEARMVSLPGTSKYVGEMWEIYCPTAQGDFVVKKVETTKNKNNGHPAVKVVNAGGREEKLASRWADAIGACDTRQEERQCSNCKNWHKREDVSGPYAVTFNSFHYDYAHDGRNSYHENSTTLLRFLCQSCIDKFELGKLEFDTEIGKYEEVKIHSVHPISENEYIAEKYLRKV
ncbi:MAG: hypothetical protein V1651_00480 [Patescibacteria group bacterium]